MWKPYGRLFCFCLALLSLFSPGHLKAAELTEAEVRAWAAGKDGETLTNALVTVTIEAEKLNRLLIEERRDLTEYKEVVTRSLDGVRIEIKTAREASVQSAMSFDEALRIQAASMTRTERENAGLKIVIGVLAALTVYSALK